jgi:hypothetical protein
MGERTLASPQEQQRRFLEHQGNLQSQRLIKMGFHSALGLSGAEYFASLPDFTALPPGLEPTDLPVLVDPRVRPSKQLAGARIHSVAAMPSFDGLVDNHFVPDKPYVAFLGAPAGQTEDQSLVPSTLLETIALALHHPDQIPLGQLYAMGSRLDGEVPRLRVFTPGTGMYFDTVPEARVLSNMAFHRRQPDVIMAPQ